MCGLCRDLLNYPNLFPSRDLVSEWGSFAFLGFSRVLKVSCFGYQDKRKRQDIPPCYHMGYQGNKTSFMHALSEVYEPWYPSGTLSPFFFGVLGSLVQ